MRVLAASSTTIGQDALYSEPSFDGGPWDLAALPTVRDISSRRLGLETPSFAAKSAARNIVHFNDWTFACGAKRRVTRIADVSDSSTEIPSHFAILRPRNPHCQGTDNQSYGLRRRRFKRQRNGFVGRIALASTNVRDFPRSRSRRRTSDANSRSCEVRPDLTQLGPISIAFARSQRPKQSRASAFARKCRTNAVRDGRCHNGFRHEILRKCRRIGFNQTKIGELFSGNPRQFIPSVCAR